MKEEKGWGEAFTFWQPVPLGIFQSDLVGAPGEAAFGVDRVWQETEHIPSFGLLSRSAPLSPPCGDLHYQDEPG